MKAGRSSSPHGLWDDSGKSFADVRRDVAALDPEAQEGNSRRLKRGIEELVALSTVAPLVAAIVELEQWDEPASGSSGEMAIRLRKARAHAALGGGVSLF